MRILVLFLFFVVYFFQFQILLADEFVMLKNNKVNVRYGPSFDYPIKYLYLKKYLPVKVIDKKENFRRIIDHKHNSGWIHISQLKKSSSIVLEKKQLIFNKPTKFSQRIAAAEKGKLILLEKCRINWCKISNESISGWIFLDKYWGKLPN